MITARDRSVFDLAKRQEGVVSYSQLSSLGVTRKALQYRLRVGEWVRAAPAVARMHWADPTWMQRVWTAWLWGKTRVVVSHQTAAAFHGFACATGETIHVTTFAGRRKLLLSPWTVTHFSRRRSDVLARDVVAGLEMTSAERTLVDLCSTLDEASYRRTFYDALRRDLVRRRALGRVLSSSNSRLFVASRRLLSAMAHEHF